MPLRSRGLTALPAQNQPVTVWDAANRFESTHFRWKEGKFRHQWVSQAAKEFWSYTWDYTNQPTTQKRFSPFLIQQSIFSEQELNQLQIKSIHKQLEPIVISSTYITIRTLTCGLHTYIQSNYLHLMHDIHGLIALTSRHKIEANHWHFEVSPQGVPSVGFNSHIPLTSEGQSKTRPWKSFQGFDDFNQVGRTQNAFNRSIVSTSWFVGFGASTKGDGHYSQKVRCPHHGSLMSFGLLCLPT